jgi:hypothetical protein
VCVVGSFKFVVSYDRNEFVVGVELCDYFVLGNYTWILMRT